MAQIKETVKAFFIELGLRLVGETMVEGPLVGSLIGLKDVRTTLAMLRPPNGQGGIELDKFHTPKAIRCGPRTRTGAALPKPVSRANPAGRKKTVRKGGWARKKQKT